MTCDYLVTIRMDYNFKIVDILVEFVWIFNLEAEAPLKGSRMTVVFHVFKTF